MDENQELDSVKEPHIYEVGFLLMPALAEEKLLQIFAAIKKVLADQNATLLGESLPKSRPLAYPIKKYESAFFGWLKFESSSEVLTTLREFLKNNVEVIRFLLIKTVRESAVVAPVFFGKPRSRLEKNAKKEETAVGPKMTTEELDKTIEELVVN